MKLRNSANKRETSKWISLINHRKLWKCVILVKEKVNWKYWLPWWWIDPGEWKREALKRELREEVGPWYVIERMKDLVIIETGSQIHNVFAFYPLEDKYSEERRVIRRNMENYAVKAVSEFRHNHNWQSYEVSQPRIEWKYFDQFHRELDSLKQQITK